MRPYCTVADASRVLNTLTRYLAFRIDRLGLFRQFLYLRRCVGFSLLWVEIPYLNRHACRFSIRNVGPPDTLP
jgi:hypothetical protein